MRGAIHLLAVMLACLGTGCMTSVNVVADEHEDFSRHRRWDWLPRSARKVDAPGLAGAAVEARLARHIERGLLEKGFERDDLRADFLVSYLLRVRRQEVLVDEPSAPYLLSSHHSSASYWVEGSRRALRAYQDIRLALAVSDPAGRLIWQATLVRQTEDDSLRALDAALATLLERFPRQQPGTGRQERP